MFKFTKTGVFCLSIIILFFVMQIFIQQYSIKSEINEEIMEQIEIEQNEMPVEETTNETEENEKTIEETTNEKVIWQIEIPKISLIAPISEGTTKEILDKYVGHFEETSKEQGNVGLAAHNRGYDVNYFKDLKLLQEGDEIKYTYNQFQTIYEVEKCRIIKDTDWEYLEETEEDMLTLITCVENQPEYRRCIQAIKKEEE